MGKSLHRFAIQGQIEEYTKLNFNDAYSGRIMRLEGLKPLVQNAFDALPEVQLKAIYKQMTKEDQELLAETLRSFARWLAYTNNNGDTTGVDWFDTASKIFTYSVFVDDVLHGKT